MKLAPRIASTVAIMALAAGALFASPLATGAPAERFPHEKHSGVFPLCSTCHAGVTDPAKSIWPDPARCAACHDGEMKRKVPWQPRVGPRPGNLRFTHLAHDRAATAKDIANGSLIRNCAACHNKTGTVRMAVRPPIVNQCLTCHGLKGPHVDVPSQACATCHVRLSDAPSLTREAIAKFPAPSSHDAPDFKLGGHGKLARLTSGAKGETGIAANCATCHSRNLCLACHVNAAESKVITALALDDRTPAYAGTQPIPASHASSGFLSQHGRDAQRGTASCATCHSRESCMTCHVGIPPKTIAALPVAGPGRAVGAQLVRKPPPNHTSQFREGHGPEASARPRTCETCHARSSCLTCHRPDAGPQSRYHPQNFLTRHPASAYAREANCSDCHNAAQFCQACHQQAGLVATARLGGKGFHDAFRGFSLGHGQAARQSLESCASCHAERDCTACHSAVGGGFRFSPHGPGFNAARARSKNPSVCIACHGTAIPGAP